MTERWTNRRIYLDANAFIYAVEGVDEISVLLRSLFEALKQQANYVCTSEFTLAEVLPKTSHRKNYLTLILRSGLFDLLPVTRDILIETADYRKFIKRPPFETRDAMPKLPDAIHVVTAVHAGCNTFVSFDRGLKLPAGLDRVGREDGSLLQLLQDIS